MEAIVDDIDIPNERVAWVQAAEAFVKPVYNRTEVEMSRILTLISRLPFFTPLSFEKRLAIAKVSTFKRVGAGEVLAYVAGADGNAVSAGISLQPPVDVNGKVMAADVCTVVYGRVALRLQTVTGRTQSMLLKGETFGNPLTMKALPPGSMYVSEEPTEVLCLSQNYYTDHLSDLDEEEVKSRVAFFQKLIVPVFASWRYEDFETLARAVFPLQCQSREVIVKESDPADAVFFLTYGKLKVVREVDFTQALGQPCVKLLELATLSPGEYFGELALLRYSIDEKKKQKYRKISTIEEFDDSDGSDDERELRQIDAMIPSRPRQATVYAHTPAVVLVLIRSKFISLVTGNALVRMREYAKGYPSEQDVRLHYLKQQRWEAFKHEVTLQVDQAAAQSSRKK